MQQTSQYFLAVPLWKCVALLLLSCYHYHSLHFYVKSGAKHKEFSHLIGENKPLEIQDRVWKYISVLNTELCIWLKGIWGHYSCKVGILQSSGDTVGTARRKRSWVLLLQMWLNWPLEVVWRDWLIDWQKDWLLFNTGCMDKLAVLSFSLCVS